jgi:hypothetical protein
MENRLDSVTEMTIQSMKTNEFSVNTLDSTEKTDKEMGQTINENETIIYGTK